LLPGRDARLPHTFRYHFFMPDLDWIRRLCLSLPDVTEDMPWADDLCFKVRGKIFTGVPLSEGRFPRVTLKCDAETFNELLEIEGIVPAPYVGRYKWVQISKSNLLAAAELETLIRNSYELVASKAPQKKITRRAKRKKSKKSKKSNLRSLDPS
jgi:predicted DNA-binding protein (MmcQ/YjbR family)